MPRKAQSIYISLCTFVVIATAVAAAQSKTRYDLTVPLGRNSSWQVAQSAGASIYKLAVVTIDHPDRRKSCRVKAFSSDKLVCSRIIGTPKSYRPEQVIAIIVPGDGGLRIPLWLGLNAGLGAAIWGTVVLTATCPPCAAGTALAALLLFSAAGAVAYTDDVPDRTLYLAEGHKLSTKLGYVED